MSESAYHKIENYLTGQLSDEEVIAFEKDIQNDKALADALALQKLEHDAMDRILETDLKSKMAKWKKTPPPNPFENDPTSSKKNPPSKSWTGWLFGLLGLLIFAGIVYTNLPASENVIQDKSTPTPSSEPSPFENVIPIEEESSLPNLEEKKIEEEVNSPPLASDKSQSVPKTNPPKKENRYLLLAQNTYESIPSIVSNLRSGEGGNSEKSDLERAAEAYDQKQYAAAQKFIGNPADTDESTVRYLRGHIYFNLENYQGAAKEFEAVASEDFARDKEGAQWYLLLTYLMQFPDTKTKFDSLGKTLSENEFFSKREEVQQLIKKVVEIK
ncbi:MAG: tol-pal system YbgF family protein [Saprospiraceae bacterium]